MNIICNWGLAERGMFTDGESTVVRDKRMGSVWYLYVGGLDALSLTHEIV